MNDYSFNLILFCNSPKIDFGIVEQKLPTSPTIEENIKDLKQQKDYEKHGYLSELKIYLGEKEGKRRSNIVRLNDIEVTVPDSEMLLFIFLLLELIKGEGGWVKNIRIYQEQIVPDGSPEAGKFDTYREYTSLHRLVDRLRKSLKAGLSGKNSKDFIENDAGGRYRISTHPDFITISDENWLKEKYNEIKKSILHKREIKRKREQRQNRRLSLV
ncbi:hypothetical protein ACFLQ1_01470 [Candidatus Auribacterota bacterium]